MNNDFRNMNFSGIYEIRNLENNKRYIGSSKNIHKRWLQHRWELEHNRHHSRHLQTSWNKHGESKFQLFVLEKTDIDFFEEKEKYYIDLFKTTFGEYGYNETIGGKGCPERKISVETREKISKSNKGRKVSEIGRQRMSESGKGRKHTEETKQKMSTSRKGKHQWWNPKGKNISEHVKKAVGDFHRGRKRPKETGDKISLSKLGNKTNRKTSSKYVGVSKSKNKWKAYISVDKKRIGLKEHDTEIQAAQAYNEAALKYFGNNAKLNNIEEDL